MSATFTEPLAAFHRVSLTSCVTRNSASASKQVQTQSYLEAVPSYVIVQPADAFLKLKALLDR
jgi:hypothetical protein